MRALFAAALAAAVLPAGRLPEAAATLDTPDFRAVAVAHAFSPISNLAIAPDGRLFATIQAHAQTSGTTPGDAEIRVYDRYRTTDGSTLDEGRLWATIDGVRATTSEEGVLGIAIPPDFSSSKLLYVYLTTTDENVNQHVRVYHENAAGTGDFVATVATSLEPPTESTNRNGAGLRFGVDGCLYVGVGDNGSNNRWNAQLLAGTDPIQGNETSNLCTNVCLGPATFPDRSAVNNGAQNLAGKILRMDVDGTGTAQPAANPPLATDPLAFSAGLRNPVGLGVHPLTGQLWATERGDSLESEIDVIDGGGDYGWPCIEGTSVPANAACLVGGTADTVYANHPGWRRPLLTHTGNPALTGITAYTGLGYPGYYYGDVFYLMRDSDRIYRIDLAPPCFLPHPNGVTPIAFHDSQNDDDFAVFNDFDGDGQFETFSFPVLMSIVQGPDPRGDDVLYIAGKQGNSSAFNEQSVIFRIEYTGNVAPYAGRTGRVADSCFANGTYSGGGSGAAPYGYENPFARPACIVAGGPCAGQPDGTACDDGDPCNGADTCAGGFCQHGSAPADGTPCGTNVQCHATGACVGGACVPGATLPDGTACSDGDPCTTADVCAGGTCRPGGGPSPLNVRALLVRGEGHGPGSGALSFTGSIQPGHALAPKTDPLTVEVRDGGTVLFSGTAGDGGPGWRSPRNGVFRFRSRRTPLSSVSFRSRRSGAVDFDIRAARAHVAGTGAAAPAARLVIGDQCFAADLTGRCRSDARKLRCGP